MIDQDKLILTRRYHDGMLVTRFPETHKIASSLFIDIVIDYLKENNRKFKITPNVEFVDDNGKDCIVNSYRYNKISDCLRVMDELDTCYIYSLIVYEYKKDGKKTLFYKMRIK